jgi:hypothetical protein
MYLLKIYKAYEVFSLSNHGAIEDESPTLEGITGNLQAYPLARTAETQQKNIDAVSPGPAYQLSCSQKSHFRLIGAVDRHLQSYHA